LIAFSDCSRNVAATLLAHFISNHLNRISYGKSKRDYQNPRNTGRLDILQTKTEQLIRRKGGVSKKRIARDAAFARTRENNQEFSSCAKSGRRLRNASWAHYFLGKRQPIDQQVASNLVEDKVLG